MPTTDFLPLISERIPRDFDPLRIILFGLTARGDNQSDSDLDLLVVLSPVDNKRKAAVAIRRLLSDLPVAKAIFVTTPDEIEKRGQLVGDVLREALLEGRVVYARPGTGGR